MTAAKIVTFDSGDWAKLRSYLDDEFGQGFANMDHVFRGEPMCYSTVLPPFDRVIGPSADLGMRLSAEMHAMRRFMQNGAMHVSAIERDMLQQGLQAQVVMRHYRAPTRLIDWSESPWIALFFACSGAAHEGGRILVFSRRVLEQHVRDNHHHESRAHAELVKVNGDWIVPRLLTKDFAEGAAEWVVCYHRHSEKFPRLVAQQGLFTIASKPRLDHWATIQALVPDHIAPWAVVDQIAARAW